MLRAVLTQMSKRFFSKPKASQPRRSVRLGLERLETREVPTVVSVQLTGPNGTSPATVMSVDQSFDETITAYNAQGNVATGFSGYMTQNWIRPDGSTGTGSIGPFTSGVYHQPGTLSEAGLYKFSIADGSITSNTLKVTGVAPVLTTLTASPTLQNPLPLGSVFVGQSFQFSVTAYDQGLNPGSPNNVQLPWLGPLTLNLNDATGNDGGSEIPLYQNYTTVTNVPLTPNQGFASITLTAAGSAAGEGGPAILKVTATGSFAGSSITLVNRSTVTAITNGFVFHVSGTNLNEITTATVFIPTQISGGPITVNGVSTNLYLNTLTASGYGYVFNWVESIILNSAGNPGTPAGLPNTPGDNVYGWVTGISGLSPSTYSNIYISFLKVEN